MTRGRAEVAAVAVARQRQELHAKCTATHNELTGELLMVLSTDCVVVLMMRETVRSLRD